MKVHEVLEILKDVDPNRDVFVSSDEEGNEYRPADFDVTAIMCDQDGEWVSVHPEDLADGEYEGWEDQMVDAVVVW